MGDVKMDFLLHFDTVQATIYMSASIQFEQKHLKSRRKPAIF